MDVDKILGGIHAIAGNKAEARRWVSEFILSSMSTNALAYAVKNNIDPWWSVVENYHLRDSGIALLVRGIVEDHWNGRGGIEDTLTNVRKVYNRLSRNPTNREQLMRRETIDWLNRAVTWVYHRLYEFAILGLPADYIYTLPEETAWGSS